MGKRFGHLRICINHEQAQETMFNFISRWINVD